MNTVRFCANLDYSFHKSNKKREKVHKILKKAPNRAVWAYSKQIF